jgi:hypothetical protein
MILELIEYFEKIFPEVKRWTRKICIKKKTKQKFDENTFRSKVLSRVNSSFLQLNIRSRVCEEAVLWLATFSLSISNAIDLQQFPNYEQLFSNSNSLNLTNNDTMESLPDITNCTVISLSSFHKLWDLRSLSDLQNVSLSYCCSLVDVNCLRNVRKLHIFQCNHIQDISALRRIHSLEIVFCEGITDISSLTDNYSLCFIAKTPQIYLFPRVINSVKLTTNLTGLFESINLYQIKSLEYDNVPNPLNTIGNIDFTHLHTLNLSRSGITFLL